MTQEEKEAAAIIRKKVNDEPAIDPLTQIQGGDRRPRDDESDDDGIMLTDEGLL